MTFFNIFYMAITDRLQDYMNFKGLNPNKITVEAGLSVGLIGKSFKNKKGLNSDTIEKILYTYPDLSPEWLLTGRGQMLKPAHENQSPNITILKGSRGTRDAMIEHQEIPLYDLEATAGLSTFFKGDKSANLLDTIKIPNAPICDGALFAVGDSMYPLLKSGDIILYKEMPLNMDYIFWGEMYLLSFDVGDWEESIVIKFVKKSDEGKNYIQLVSQNPHHTPKDIPFSWVRAMALIKVTIRINTMR